MLDCVLGKHDETGSWLKCGWRKILFFRKSFVQWWDAAWPDALFGWAIGSAAAVFTTALEPFILRMAPQKSTLLLYWHWPDTGFFPLSFAVACLIGTLAYAVPPKLLRSWRAGLLKETFFVSAIGSSLFWMCIVYGRVRSAYSALGIFCSASRCCGCTRMDAAFA